MRTFALYPEEQHFWSVADYGAVLDVVHELGAKRVLEFGPGSSTLALIEGGAEHIDTCEDDPEWAAVHEARLAAKYPAIVTLHRYTWGQPVSIPAINANSYDLALIDGPWATGKRLSVLSYALARCTAVLLPLDDVEQLKRRVEQLSRKPYLSVEMRETGPLAGSFALIQRREVQA